MDSNLESFACLWLDENVNSIKSNRETQQELRQVINHLRTFVDSVECEEYIRRINREKVIVIASSSLSRQIVPRIHGLPQFSAFYIYSKDKNIDEQWVDKYHKVKYFINIVF